MKAIAITRQGSPVSPNVALVDMPAPTPPAGAVRVRTEAAALNHLDLWVGMGLPGIDTTYPFVSGSDGAGVVDALGPGVDQAWLGRRVLLNAAVVQPPNPMPGQDPAGEVQGGVCARRRPPEAHSPADRGRPGVFRRVLVQADAAEVV